MEPSRDFNTFSQYFSRKSFDTSIFLNLSDCSLNVNGLNCSLYLESMYTHLNQVPVRNLREGGKLMEKDCSAKTIICQFVMH